MQRSVACLSVAMVLGMAWTAAVAAPVEAHLDRLLAKVPPGANVLMLVNVPELLDAEVAQRQSWGVLLEMHPQARGLVVPTPARLLVRAMACDLSSMQPIWDLALLQLVAAPDLQRIAQREGGRTDVIHGAAAAWSPRDMYLLDLGAGAVAAYAPADRQQVSRWFTAASRRAVPALSPYLSEAVVHADLHATQLVMAIDLTGAFSPQHTGSDLAAFESIRSRPADVDPIADAVAGIQGVTLAVSFAQQATATLTFTFDRDVSFMAPYARDMVVEALHRRGMLVIEVQHWDTSVQGRTITMTGPMYGSGIRRLMSYFNSPTLNIAAIGATIQPQVALDPHRETPLAPPAREIPPSPVDTVARSQEYFAAVAACLDAVLRADKADASQLGDVAFWLDHYARRIERIPIDGVDPHLLEWSAHVRTQLTQCSIRLKHVQLRSAQRMAAHSNFYDTTDTGGSPTVYVGLRYGGRVYDRVAYDGYRGYSAYRGFGTTRSRYNTYSGYDVYEIPVAVERYRLKYQEAVRRQIGIEEKAQGIQEALAILGQLQDDTARTRREMNLKHHSGF